MFFGGLLAIDIIILPSLISLNSLDTAALISLISIYLSIPLLAAPIVLGLLELSFDPSYSKKEPTRIFVTYMLGISAALIGITAAIWYASWIGGIVFAVTSIIAFAVFWPIIATHFYGRPSTTSISQPDVRESDSV